MKRFTWSKLGIVTLAVALLALAVLPTGSVGAYTCTPGSSGNPACLLFEGSTTVYPVMYLAQWHFPTNPNNGVSGVTFDLNQTDSGNGRVQLLKGLVDVAMSSGNCTNGDDSSYIYQCPGASFGKPSLVDTIFAEDAISIIVNKNLPANCTPDYVTKADLASLYTTGGITRWNQLHGVNASACNDSNLISIYAREIGSGTRSSFVSLVGSGLSEAIEQTAGTNGKFTRTTSNTDMEVHVKNNPNGLGYVGLHFLYPDDVKAIPVFNASSSQGVLPDVSNVLDLSYPLSRNLHLFTAPSSSNNKPAIQSLLSFVNDPDGQMLVKETGYVAIHTIAPNCDVQLDETCDSGDVSVVGLPSNWLHNGPNADTTTPSGFGPSHWLRADTNTDGTIDAGDIGTIGLPANWLKYPHVNPD